ncbi:hypothetical protein B0H21DRAFT_819824 [Amylocystis lapponica]|nr:hypothetical protein B0H21DRAFT_819824 [Amylocystis lapponica]
MDGKFASVELDTMMNTFVRCTGDSPKEKWRGMFNNIKNDESEENIQRKFMRAITKKNILGDDYKAVSSFNRGDPSDASKQKPDAGVYPTSVAPTYNRTIWATIRLSIEFKKETTQDDPFDDDDPLNSFEATALKRKANRGQIIHSASEIFLRQHRCFLYSVIILGTSARIIRWDRSGALVTTKFDYKKQPQAICEFLWYFGRMSAEDQGYDPSVVPVTKEEYNLMDTKAKEELPRDENNNENVREYVRKYFKRSLADGWQRYKVEVPLNEDNEETYAKIYGHGAGNGATASTGEKKTGTFLICQPHFSAFGVVGRGTRGYVAIDCSTRDFVFLKDAWRVDLPDTEREGDVLQTLNDKGRTVTQDFSLHKTDPSRRLLKPDRFKPHCHYRLVEKEVGQALEEFWHSRDLVAVVLDCLFAHSDAVEKAGILHRDISVGNMLMIKEMSLEGIQHRGLLNDWELSKKIPVGTWLFLSAASLNDKYKQMVLQDDLESFFHVLLYMAIQHLPSNCPDVDKFIESFFEGASITDGEYTCGEAKMSAMENGVIRINTARELLKFYMPVEGVSNDTAGPSSGPPGPSIYRMDRPDGLPNHAAAILCRTKRIEHFINVIFTTLLSWFSAYYEERRRILEATRDDNPFLVPTVQSTSNSRYIADPKILNAKTIAATKPVTEANLKDTKLAEALSEHMPMIQRLWFAGSVLPDNDEVDVRAAQAKTVTRRDHVVVPAAPASTRSSSKHDSPDPEREADAPSPKRPRISQVGRLLASGIKRPLSGPRRPTQASGSSAAPSRGTRGGYKKAGPSKSRGSTGGSKGYSGRG